MKFAAAFLFTLIVFVSFGQVVVPAPAPLDPKIATLQERYSAMKKTAETYQDYKVIKEGTLDVIWRTVIDSIKNQKAKFHDTKQIIAKLESDLAAEKESLKQMKVSTELVNFDSTHISFFGLSFTKSLFVSLVVICLAVLLIAIGALGARLKLIQNTTKEKSTAVDELTHEFEEYKKRALEKQAKISRELQTERNKLLSFESKSQSKSIL
jgi:hypothetical protein